MRVRDIAIEEVIAGSNWRVVDSSADEIVDWQIEPCADPRPGETVVYSALSVSADGDVHACLLIRDVETYDWWGDTCEYVDGAWRLIGRSDWCSVADFVANPSPHDPSFSHEYSHERMRAGFLEWRSRLRR